MTSTTTLLCEIIEGTLGCDPVDPARLRDPELLVDLGADSLDMVELLMDIEVEFSVSISDDEADPFLPRDIGTTRPLSELVKMIDAKKAAFA